MGLGDRMSRKMLLPHSDSIFAYNNFRNHIAEIVCDLTKAFQGVNYDGF
jgi:hypothetical protein